MRLIVIWSIGRSLSALSATTQPETKLMQIAHPGKPFNEGNVQCQDRRWFDDRPKRTYRLRHLFPNEFPEVNGDTHVIVMKLAID